MNPIAIFYHTCVNIGSRGHATAIINEQVGMMKTTGLLDAAQWFFVGVNGDQADVDYVQSLLPAKAVVFGNPSETWPSGEVPTIKAMQEWMPSHNDYYVCYLHMKGLSTPWGHFRFEDNRQWRADGMRVCVKSWTLRVSELNSGKLTTGHNLTTQFNGSYYAGNFWWAKASYLSKLPEIKIYPGACEGGRYEAELWIGKGDRFIETATTLH